MIVMPISSSNIIVESRRRSEHARFADQGNGGQIERVTVCSGSFCFCKQCCWKGDSFRDRSQQGN